MDDRGKQFGIERMCAALEEVRGQKVEEIRDHLIAAVMKWTSIQVDDITLVVARHLGESAVIPAHQKRALKGGGAAPAARP